MCTFFPGSGSQLPCSFPKEPSTPSPAKLQWGNWVGTRVLGLGLCSASLSCPGIVVSHALESPSQLERAAPVAEADTWKKAGTCSTGKALVEDGRKPIADNLRTKGGCSVPDSKSNTSSANPSPAPAGCTSREPGSKMTGLAEEKRRPGGRAGVHSDPECDSQRGTSICHDPLATGSSTRRKSSLRATAMAIKGRHGMSVRTNRQRTDTWALYSNV